MGATVPRTRTRWVGARVGLLLAALACVLAAALGVPAGAHAISQEDKEDIGYLKSIYSIEGPNATETDLAHLLDSKLIGATIRGQIACAVHGEDAFTNHAVDRTLLEAYAGELTLIAQETSFENLLFAAVEPQLGFGTQVLDEVTGNLGAFGDQVSVLVKAIAKLETYPEYKALLLLYHNSREEGVAAEQAQGELREIEGPVLAGVAHSLAMSESQLLGGYEYTSDCMTFAQSAEARGEYREFIEDVTERLHEYEQKGGNTQGGLELIPTGGSFVEAVNNGKGLLNEVTVTDAGGHTLASVPGTLGPGEAAQLSLPAGTPANATFAVDGIEGVTRGYSEITGELYVGEPVAQVSPSEPNAVTLKFLEGPFAAANLTPSYSWEPEAGKTLQGSSVHYHDECYGQATASFTASAGSQTAKRSVTVKKPPPFDLAWATTSGETEVAPGVPLTFRADPSIPKEAQVSWVFEEHQAPQEGHEVPHTFTSGGSYRVTMSVKVGPASCSALTVTHEISVGRSGEWVGLYGTIPSMTLHSNVSGYVVYGPTIVAKTATLTVPAGVNVKFVSANGEPGQLIVEGALHVEGASSAPAVFTSRFDDSAGGHCTCAPTGHSPEPGDWYGVTVQGGTASIKHAAIRYAGPALETQTTGGRLAVESSSVSYSGSGVVSKTPNTISVSSSTFARDGSGASFECFACSYTPQLTNDTFEEDTVGVSFSGLAAPHADHSDFVDVGVAAEGLVSGARTLITHSTVSGGGGYIELFGGSFPPGATSMASDLPYILLGEATVPATGALSFPPGTVMKVGGSPGNPGELIVNGSLLLAGRPGDPVTVTSENDTSVGGECSCLPHGKSPATGDWTGLRLESGAQATVEDADLRYASTGVLLEGEGAQARVASSEIEKANTGVWANGTGTVAEAINSSFPGTSEAISLTHNATGVIRGSSFEPAQIGVQASEQADAQATYDWWGATNGPRPGGSGALVSGNVTTSPLCTNDGCREIQLSLNHEAVLADGETQTTATITVSQAGVADTGGNPTLASSDPQEQISPITNNYDGTYSAVITASKTLGEATITAADTEVTPAATATGTLKQVLPRKLKLKLKPSSVTAGAGLPTTATVTVTAGGAPTPGEHIGFSSPEPGVKFGAVTDHGDGTYSASVTPSPAVGNVTITATDTTLATHPSTSSTLKQRPPKVKVSLKPSSIPASGVATTTVTVTVSAGKARLAGQSIQLSSSDPGELIGPVTGNGDGTYTATITASSSAGTATISATDATVAPAALASATLKQT